MAVADIFRALGDPIRLEIVQRLAKGRPSTISSVSSGLGISRQGARKHLRSLEGAGIVSLAAKGREIMVELDVRRLDQAKEFISRLEKQWDERLDALKHYLERDNP